MRNALVTLVALAALALPAAAVARTAAATPVVINVTAVNGRPVGGIKRVTVKKGSSVRVVVRTNVGSEVHLHGYNIQRTPVRGKPTVIAFVAKVPGRFDLELHHPDALLAQITVR
jgi:hypothetical protein